MRRWVRGNTEEQILGQEQALSCLTPNSVVGKSKPNEKMKAMGLCNLFKFEGSASHTHSPDVTWNIEEIQSTALKIFVWRSIFHENEGS
jgi:hypothetical protein